MESRNNLISKCKQMGIVVWLPTGENIHAGNSCFPTPFKHFGHTAPVIRGSSASAVSPHSGRKPGFVGSLRRLGMVSGFRSRLAFLGQHKF